MEAVNSRLGWRRIILEKELKKKVYKASRRVSSLNSDEPGQRNAKGRGFYVGVFLRNIENGIRIQLQDILLTH